MTTEHDVATRLFLAAIIGNETEITEVYSALRSALESISSQRDGITNVSVFAAMSMIVRDMCQLKNYSPEETARIKNIACASIQATKPFQSNFN